MDAVIVTRFAVRSRARLTLLAVLGALTPAALSAGTAWAQVAPSGPSAPLAGSAFQGGDGNQDDQAPYVDWEGFRAAVVHSPDPNTPDSAFAGGTTEDEPGKWDLTSEQDGVNPPKDNILDAWSAVDQPAADTFLYLAFTRQKADGDTFLAFELNQDARLWNNGRAQVPCRRTGDVLVVIAAHGTGIEVVLEQWTTSATDPATGCSTRGRLTAVASVAASDAQGGVNGVPITSHLDGFYRPGTTIPEAGLFAEAALNLTALLDAALGDQCFAFGSVWMHSRSSTSESSQMQDYVAPQPIAVRQCAASGTKFYDLNANGQFDAGEPGIPRFLIWADYDDDGVRDAVEPFTVSDDQGHYVLKDIRSPNGSYTLRETLLPGRGRAAATNWICSYPHDGTQGGFGSGPNDLFGCGWGPIAAATTPHAQQRDFGNWLPQPPPEPTPPGPTPPTPTPAPGPSPSAPVVPPGPTPPRAGPIGVAGLQVRRGCVARVSQVRLLGTRITRIRVRVDGRRVSRQSLRILQRSAQPLPRLFGPGRHRVTVRVTFERGSGSPPVTLTRTFTICAQPGRQPDRQPDFTG